MNNELNASNSDNHLSEMAARMAEAQAGLAKSVRSIDIPAFCKSFDHISTLTSFNQEYLSSIAEKMNFFVPDERLLETTLHLNETLVGFSELTAVCSDARVLAFGEKMNFFIPDESLSVAAFGLNETLFGFSKISESFDAIYGLTSIYSDAHASALVAVEGLFLPAIKVTEIVSEISNDHARLLKTIDSINLPTRGTPTLDSGDLESITPVPQRHKKSKHETKREAEKIEKRSKSIEHETEVVPEILGEGEMIEFSQTVEIDGKIIRVHSKHSVKLLWKILDDPMKKHLN